MATSDPTRDDAAGDAPRHANARLAQKAIPVTVLTGFLGSGKTTLLNRLLGHDAMDETAVLINEFGEIGLDHLLVKETREDTVLLNSGCLCCTVRGDLVNAMRELFWKRFDKEIPWFRRMIIETTGLADPAPIIHTLMTDPNIGPRYRLDGIVTTIDAVNGAGQLDDHPEGIKQAAVADRIVLTKTDLATPEQVAAVKERLHALNPAAPVIDAAIEEVHPDALFDAGLFDAGRKTIDVRGWLHEEAYRAAEREQAHEHDDHDHDHGHGHGHGGHGHHHHHDVNRHDDRISSFCMTVERPVPWTAFVTWIEMLIATQGENLLRIKGILNVEGEDAPVAVHGVQHLFHPPVALPDWPDDDRRSKIVFITRDIGRQAIEETFKAFVEAAA